MGNKSTHMPTAHAGHPHRRTHLRPKVVAKATGLNVNTIYRMVYSGLLKSVRIAIGTNSREIHLIPIEDFEKVFETTFEVE